MERKKFFGDSSTSTSARPATIIRMGQQKGRTGELPRPARVEDLPPPGTTRWVMRRKAEVVVAVRAGLLTLEEACTRYTLSVEEFLSWQELIDRHGVRALRATRVKDYRTSEGSGRDPSSSGETAGSRRPLL